jgi:hypothetical protein
MAVAAAAAVAGSGSGVGVVAVSGAFVFRFFFCRANSSITHGDVLMASLISVRVIDFNSPATTLLF